MRASPRAQVISRRSALTGLAVGGLGLTVVPRTPDVLAQAQQVAPATHPVVGTWLIRSVNGLGLATFAADGWFTQEGPPSQPGATGVVLSSASAGRWESAGPRAAHYTALQLLSDPDGAFTGTITFDGHPVVSADGLSLLDNAPETAIVTRDASDQVVSVVGGNGGVPPIVGRRIGPNAGIFQAEPPATEPKGE